MFCRNCGKPIFEGDSFCTFCGARATDAADGRTVNRPPIENPGPAPKKIREQSMDIYCDRSACGSSDRYRDFLFCQNNQL